MKLKTIICISACAMLLQATTFAITKVNGSNAVCPEISQVQKDQTTQKWRAQTQDGTWKSYQTSFATDLIQFLGAQWLGEGVGQMTCVYKAEQRFTMAGNLTIQPALPVMLVFHAPVFQPTEGKWEHNVHDVYNCHADHEDQCPFKIYIEQKTKNVYQEAESLKSGKTNAIQPENY